MIKLNPFLILYTRINSKWIKEPLGKKKKETTHALEENIGELLYNLRIEKKSPWLKIQNKKKY